MYATVFASGSCKGWLNQKDSAHPQVAEVAGVNGGQAEGWG